MSLRYPYKAVSVAHAIVSLGGGWVRPRPVIGVTVIGPTDSRLRQALLDTGADDTVFSEDLAAQIGIDLTNAPAGAGAGVASGPVPLRYAEVILRITDGVEQREWKAWVGFTPAQLHYPTLGFAGFLQFFTASFHGDRQEVELSVNGLYPGS
jgi:hypothetical protein